MIMPKIMLFMIPIIIITNTSVFFYSQYIFLKKQNPFLTYGATGIINILFFISILYFKIPLVLAMILYVLVYGSEFYFLYKEHVLKIIFGTLSFGINFFALRLLVSVIYSIYTATPFHILLTINFHNALLISITLFLSALYLVFFTFIFPISQIHLFSSDKSILYFTDGLLISLYLFMLIISPTLYIESLKTYDLYIYIALSIFIFICFLLIVSYGYLYAKLTLFKVRDEETDLLIKNLSDEYNSIEFALNHDAFTNTYNRPYGLKLIDSLVKNKSPFTIIFFDIDKLKFVNDTFGHNEGDWYIKQVANILQNIFTVHPICRLGGDEFLAVIQNCNMFFAIRFAIRAYKSVESLKKLYKKNYTPSISYGIVEYTAKEATSAEELIATADKRMYLFKKTRGKQR